VQLVDEVARARSGTLRRGGLAGRAGLVGCPDRDRPGVARQQVIDDLAAGLLVDQDLDGERQRRQGAQEPATWTKAALTTSSWPRTRTSPNTPTEA
jgi:hypothetical protein